MPAVPDSSPLIILSKIEKIELLPKLYGRILITPWEWEESVPTSKTMGARDAGSLEKVVQRAELTKIRLKIEEKSLTEKLIQSGTGVGEAEVLSVARARKALAVLDDKDARAAALGLGVDHVGTVGVLYEAFIRKLIKYEDLLELLEKFSRVAWISPELLAGVIRKAREVNEK